MRNLTGAETRQLVDTILDRAGFDRPSLDDLLFSKMNVRLDDVVGGGPFRHVVFELVRWVDGQGRIQELLDALEKARPRNDQVKEAVTDLRRALGIPP